MADLIGLMRARGGDEIADGLQPEFFHPAPNRDPGNAQHPGRLRLVALGSFQSLDQLLSLLVSGMGGKGPGQGLYP
jgi:hypothetical protein